MAEVAKVLYGQLDPDGGSRAYGRYFYHTELGFGTIDLETTPGSPITDVGRIAVTFEASGDEPIYPYQASMPGRILRDPSDVGSAVFQAARQLTQ